MERMIVVELRDRRLHLRGRQRVDTFPATLGRAYDNTVIIDDRYVDPHHARLILDQDGCIVLEDLGSVNGIVEGVAGERRERLRLPSGGTARLGETIVRVVDAGHPVAPAVARAGESRLARALRQPAVAWGVIAATALVSMIGVWLTNFGTIRLATLVSGAVFLVLGLAMWAGVWALVGRALASQPRFLTHLAVAASGIVASAVMASLLAYVEFALPDAGAVGVLRFLTNALILAAVLNLHLSLVSTMLPSRRRIVALAGTLAFFAVINLGNWAARDEFDSSLQYSDRLEPYGASLVHARSLDQFLGDVSRVQARVDSMAERASRR